MKRSLAKAAVGCLVLVVSGVATPLLVGQQQSPAPTTPASQQAPSSQPQTPSHLPPVELPENPGQNSTNTTQQTTPPAAPQAAPQPNGTAVAPPVEVSGGAASKPAGVAIAPPKQRRVRSLLIKLGVLAGAGVAVGTVVGLSAASPGHVPNAPGH